MVGLGGKQDETTISKAPCGAGVLRPLGERGEGRGQVREDSEGDGGAEVQGQRGQLEIVGVVLTDRGVGRDLVLAEGGGLHESETGRGWPCGGGDGAMSTVLFRTTTEPQGPPRLSCKAGGVER